MQHLSLSLHCHDICHPNRYRYLQYWKFYVANIGKLFDKKYVMGRHTWLGNQSVQKGDPYFMSITLPEYTKLHASASDRVQHLRAKGLNIPMPRVAARKIEMIGYERLRIYFLSRRDHTITGKPFFPNTNYKDILRIYEADDKLRSVCFLAVGQFEIILRNRISEALSSRFGSHPYFEKAAFRNKELQIDALKKLSSIYETSKDRRIKHYKDNYSNPPLPAIWTLKEQLTFGAASRLIKALDNNIAKEIAISFGIHTEVLFEKWVEALVDLRNICAHHDRLFNRTFQKQIGHYTRGSIPNQNVPNNKLRAILQCIDYMMHSAGSPVRIEDNVKKILLKYPEIHLSEAGY